MITFYAQPYDLHATGFYFEDASTFESKINSIVNDYGDPVEEFEIQFIDGESLDCDLSQALRPNQSNVVDVMKAIETWSDEDKTIVIIAVGECGYAFDPSEQTADEFDVEIHEAESLLELAEQFVEDGLFGDIPDRLSAYLDYDIIARDLSADYTHIIIAGRSLIYRCA